MIAIRTLLTLTLLLGVAYPLAVTGLAQLLFPWQANGSLLTNAKQQVVGSALQMLEPGLSAPINLSLPAPLTLIHVDGPLFERVLIKLLENAVKYAGPAAQIGIDACVDGEHLQLDVWDNGPGIPSGMEQRVFDKFSRGNKESSVPGVGLGLAICQAIVDVHGGTISVHNRAQGGACFRVTLPQEIPPELEDFHEDM